MGRLEGELEGWARKGGLSSGLERHYKRLS